MKFKKYRIKDNKFIAKADSLDEREGTTIIEFEDADMSSLIIDDNDIRYKTEDELQKEQDVILEKLKQNALLKIEYTVMMFIFEKYPDVKQKSDLSDIIYFQTELQKTDLTLDVITLRVREASDLFFAEETIDDIMLTFDTDQDSWLQLIKTDVRVVWIQKCKKIYRDTITSIEKANTIQEMSLIKIPNSFNDNDALPIFPIF